MGIVLVLLGLAAAGLVADFVVENGVTTAPDQTFQVLGASFQRSGPELVLAAAVLGAVAVLFLIVGIGLLRGSRGRRRGLKRRLRELERENAELESGSDWAGVATRRHEEPERHAYEEKQTV